MHYRLLLSFFILSFATNPAAFAQNSANFAGGSVLIGDDTEACAAGKYGAVRYNTNKFQGCSTGGWVDIGTFGGGGAVNIANINATGTADNTTFLRGDGAWSAIAAMGGGAPGWRGSWKRQFAGL